MRVKRARKSEHASVKGVDLWLSLRKLVSTFGWVGKVRLKLNSLRQKELRELGKFLSDTAGEALNDGSCLLWKVCNDMLDTRLKFIPPPKVETRVKKKNPLVWKVKFCNKGLDYLSLGKVLRSTQVVNALPSDLSVVENPFVVFSYTEVIRNKIFNYSKVAKSLTGTNWKNFEALLSPIHHAQPPPQHLLHPPPQQPLHRLPLPLPATTASSRASVFLSSLSTSSALLSPTSISFLSSLKCDCKSSAFCNKDLGHVMTGDLSFVKEDGLRWLLEKGPGFRESQPLDWGKVKDAVLEGLDPLLQQWARACAKRVDDWSDWKAQVILEVNRKIDILSKKNWKYAKQPRLSDPQVSHGLKRLHERFVLIPADKAEKNVIIVCKTYYIMVLVKELLHNEKSTYEEVLTVPNRLLGTVSVASESSPSSSPLSLSSVPSVLPSVTLKLKIAKAIRLQLKNRFSIQVPDILVRLATLYWTAKMHKSPPSSRFIAASLRCVLKPLSALLTRCFRAISKQLQKFSGAWKKRTNVNPWWVADNSIPLLNTLTTLNRHGGAKSIDTFDFTTLYTNIQHDGIKKELKWVIDTAFTFAKAGGVPYLRVTNSNESFSDKRGGGTLIRKGELITMVNFLFDNLFVAVGDKVFRQVIGIPMGTDCAPYLANLYLFALEYKFLDRLFTSKKLLDRLTLNRFKHCYRYIDDLITVNNDKIGAFDFSKIYPKELVLKQTNKSAFATEFLDLGIKINKGQFFLSIYDKTDDFQFKVRKFPDLDSNVHFSRTHDLVHEVLGRFSVCSHKEQFFSRASEKISQLIGQNFIGKILHRRIHKFALRHPELLRRYKLDSGTFVKFCFTHK